MSTRETLADWIGRSTAAVRHDAQRALEELVSRGDLSTEEARAIEQAVESAVERSTTFVSENVLEPLRAVLGAVVPGGSAPDEELLARLDALDARLARIERRMAGTEEAPPDRDDPSWS